MDSYLVRSRFVWLCLAPFWLAQLAVVVPHVAAQQGPRTSTSEMGGRVLETLQQMDLTTEQRAAIAEQLRTLRDSGGARNPRAVSEFSQALAKILTPEQLAKFDAVTGRVRPVSVPAGNELVCTGTAAEQARLRAAGDYSRQHGGLSLLILRDGEVVYEDFAADWPINRPHQLASGTKSFWGVAALCAVEDGLLTLDERAADTLTEWANDPLRSQITIRQLLNFTSGLEASGQAYTLRMGRDHYDYAVSRGGQDQPGAVYRYDSAHLFAFGELLQRKLVAANTGDQTPLDYLTRRMLNPIGLEVSGWLKDRAGNPAMAYGAILTAREWAKFGELIRLDGQWDGQSIVAAKTLDQLFVGSTANPGYGLTWWLNRQQLGRETADAGADAPAAGNLPNIPPQGIFDAETHFDVVMAAGAGQQRLYVARSAGLTIVRQANRDVARASIGLASMITTFDDHEFWRLLIGNESPRAASTQAVAPTEPVAADTAAEPVAEPAPALRRNRRENAPRDENLMVREWTIDGVVRQAVVVLPTRTQPGTKSPIVFGFHGHGGNMYNSARSYHFHDLWPEAIVIYPQGLNTPGITDPEGKKPGWQNMSGLQGDRDLKLFDAMLASAIEEGGDERRVFVSGHSNGGGISYLLWAVRAERITAIAPSAAGSGGLRGTTRLPPRPVLHIAGTGDEVVPFEFQQRTLARVKENNGVAHVTPEETNGLSKFEDPAGTPVWVKVHAGGHKYLDTAPQLIVSFFQQFPPAGDGK